jgi:short-subunit dehydrogenase
VLVARREDRLEEVAADLRRDHGGRVHVIAVDGSEAGAAARLHARLAERGEVGILVNNAGFGALGPFADQPPAEIDAMLGLNIGFLCGLTRLVLPAMRARGAGRIMNLASTAAFQAGPFMAVYYATKAFVLSFSEALDEELRGTGVTVTALCPGPTTTGFQERAGVGRTPLFQGPLVMDAGRVADRGVAALLRGRRLVIPGLPNRLLTWSTRLAPRRLATAVVRRLQERR